MMTEYTCVHEQQGCVLVVILVAIATKDWLWGREWLVVESDSIFG